VRLRAAHRLEVRVEVAEQIFSDAMADMVAFTGNVSDRLNHVPGLSVKGDAGGARDGRADGRQRRGA